MGQMPSTIWAGEGIPIMGYIVIPIMFLLGQFHSLEVGAKRYANVNTDEETYSKSGVFLASKWYYSATGEMADQIVYLQPFGDAKYQDNANTAIAIHMFIK
jgi:hypothetical protein